MAQLSGMNYATKRLREWMEGNVVGLPGSTEGRLEIVSHEFKLRLRSLAECFPPVMSDAWVQVWSRWSTGFFQILVFPHEPEGGKE